MGRGKDKKPRKKRGGKGMNSLTIARGKSDGYNSLTIKRAKNG